MNVKKRHFLVIASASRGARLFIKKALQDGHSVTALCRAESDSAALERMEEILSKTNLTPSEILHSKKPGKLFARSLSILDKDTYATLLNEITEIDAICCFVGVTKLKDMLSPKTTLYTATIQAAVAGMRESRWVEFYYHGSVGTEGIPGQSTTKWPANYPFYSNIVQWVFPVFKNVTKSESILAEAKNEGLNFVVFRPAALTNGIAKRNYGYCFNSTGMDQEDLPMRMAGRFISREDTAEEILRVATLDKDLRRAWYGQGVYLVDYK